VPARSPADRLEDRLELETLISDAAAALIAADPDAIERVVGGALERVRIFFHADRCALLSVGAEQQTAGVRLASDAPGVPPLPATIVLAQSFPRSRRTLLLPIATRGIASHLIALDSQHRECPWPEAFVTRLRLLGETFVAALERREMFRGLREAENALRTSQTRLASGTDLAGLGFYEVDFDAAVMYHDDRLRDLCGFRDVTPGLEALAFWLEQTHPDDRARVVEMRRQLHTGAIDRLSIEYRYLHPERGEVWMQHLAGVGARDSSGQAVRTFGVLRDITRRKETEAELRDLSQRLLQAHEEERALLARELHDDLTQRLAVLAIDVGRAEIAAAGGPQAQTMSVVREGLVRLSEDVHSLAYQLHPSVLKEIGLAEALRTECERVERQGRVALVVEIEPATAAVGKDAALCLFRVAQEALNNALRHAGARTARLVLRPLDGGLVLAVRDDGVGFDPARPKRGRSLGLASMRERLRLVNGTLDIESAPGQGTAVVAWVPASTVVAAP